MNDGGPAFPHWREGGTWSAPGHGSGPLPPEYQPGMTLRDYFAAHAPKYPFKPPLIEPITDADPAAKVAAEIARWRFAYADAMIAERAK